LPNCTSYTNGSTENWVGDYQLCNGTWVYSGTVNPGNSICAVIGSPFTLSGVDLTAGSQCGNFYIGQPIFGGRVGYIFQPGDPGYDANVQHGIILSNVDVASTIAWWNGSNISVSTTFAIGSALTNTDAIIAAQGSGTYAATAARNYSAGGYTDWCLPTYDELEKLYLNRVALSWTLSGRYWSSSQNSASNAWYLQAAGGMAATAKSNSVNQYVRAIRYF
jgi:hypothetical protein